MNCDLLFVTSLAHLTFIVRNEQRQLKAVRSSAEREKFLCAHLKFKMGIFMGGTLSIFTTWQTVSAVKDHVI